VLDAEDRTAKSTGAEYGSKIAESPYDSDIGPIFFDRASEDAWMADHISAPRVSQRVEGHGITFELGAEWLILADEQDAGRCPLSPNLGGEGRRESLGSTDESLP
jgi:hypothetical protein